MCEGKGIWEISVLSTQFFCKPKSALKNKVYLLKKIIYGEKACNRAKKYKGHFKITGESSALLEGS